MRTLETLIVPARCDGQTRSRRSDPAAGQQRRISRRIASVAEARKPARASAQRPGFPGGKRRACGSTRSAARARAVIIRSGARVAEPKPCGIIVRSSSHRRASTPYTRSARDRASTLPNRAAATPLESTRARPIARTRGASPQVPRCSVGSGRRACAVRHSRHKRAESKVWRRVPLLRVCAIEGREIHRLRRVA
jgi:hypothetical protein